MIRVWLGLCRYHMRYRLLLVYPHWFEITFNHFLLTVALPWSNLEEILIMKDRAPHKLCAAHRASALSCRLYYDHSAQQLMRRLIMHPL